MKRGVNLFEITATFPSFFPFTRDGRKEGSGVKGLGNRDFIGWETYTTTQRVAGLARVARSIRRSDTPNPGFDGLRSAYPAQTAMPSRQPLGTRLQSLWVVLLAVRRRVTVSCLAVLVGYQWLGLH